MLKTAERPEAKTPAKKEAKKPADARKDNRDGLKAALAWRDQRYDERLAETGRGEPPARSGLTGSAESG